MSTTTGFATASLFALIAAASLVGPAAAAPATNPDPELCAEYLKDLKTYRRMAVLLGCEIPDGENASVTDVAPAKVAAAQTDEFGFPPVESEEPTAPATEFPPIVDAPESAESTPSLPPVEQASTDPEAAELPPVIDEPSHTSSGSSQGSSSSFPETAEIEPDVSFEEPSGPLAEVRTAIEEKIAEMKEEAKARVKEAILAKAEEVKERVKERVKEKIRRKIEDAIFPRKDNPENPGKSLRSKVEKRLKTAAKDAVKKLVKGHGDKGGLLDKLAQLRRR
jgi:hypothetical protein